MNLQEYLYSELRAIRSGRKTEVSHSDDLWLDFVCRFMYGECIHIPKDGIVYWKVCKSDSPGIFASPSVDKHGPL